MGVSFTELKKSILIGAIVIVAIIAGISSTAFVQDNNADELTNENLENSGFPPGGPMRIFPD